MSDKSLKICYTANSELVNFPKFIQTVLIDLRSCRFLAWRLFVRNLSAQYRQTFLGYIWLFLPPLATTAVWMFLNSNKVLNVADTGLPYAVYVMTGTLLWQGFVDALNSPIQLVQESKSMMAKINFPHEALILAGVGVVLFNFTIRLILLVGVLFWFKIPVTLNIFFAPVGIFALIALGLMVGVVLLPLAMLYGDVQRTLMIVTSFWFFLTPVVYPAPSTWPASLIVKMNPVSPLLLTSRQWMTGGEATDLVTFSIVVSVTLVLGLVGWLIYRLAVPYLIERIGA